MKFSEYIKQLNGYAPNNIVSINYKNKSFLYKEEENNYDNLNVTGDGFIKIKEYLDWNVVGVEVFLSDNDEKSNCLVLEMLKMKHMAELKSKQRELESIRKYEEYLEEREKELNQKAQQELEEYNAWWDKHRKEQWLELFLCVGGFLLAIGIAWLLSKIG